MSAVNSYVGDAGEDYYHSYQREKGVLGGKLNAPKFAPYLQPRDAVLDFGCGGGFLLANLDVARRVGVEVNPAAAAEAAEQGIEVHAEPSTVPAGSIDAVISNHALEHVEDPAAVLRSLRNTLKPGGLIVLRLPIEDWRRQRRPQRHDPDRHLYGWTPRLINNLFDVVGFELVEARVVTWARPPKAAQLLEYPVLLRTAAWLWSVLRRRREFHAVGKVRPDGS